MAEDEDQKIKADFEDAKAARQNWESLWQDISDLVEMRNDFTVKREKGNPRHNRVFDSTAIRANSQLAAGLESFLVNPRTKWFELRIPGEVGENPDVQQWLTEVRDRILEHLSKPEVNFYPAVHEGLIELGAYGTMVHFIEDQKNGPSPRFVSRPLPEVFLRETDDGKIDVVFRKFKMTVRQAAQMYGADNLPDRLRKKLGTKNQNAEEEFMQAVLPRSNFDETKPKTAGNKKWRSVHFAMTKGERIRESGFDDFPFTVTRWTKATNEVYGRSPTMEVLPDIRMLQEMSKTVIRAAQKIVDPPLIVQDDGAMSPVKTMPGGLNYFRSSVAGSQQAPVQPLQTGGRVDIGVDLIQQRQQAVQQSYMIPEILGLISRGDSSPLKATEVVGRQQQALRQLAPILSRLQNEFLVPAVDRVFSVMLRNEELPTPPEEIQGEDFNVEFVSQAALAQQAAENENILNWLQQVLPVLQIDPQASMNIDTDEFVRRTGKSNNVPPELLVDRDLVDQQRQQNAQQSQQQNLVQTLSEAGPGIQSLSEGAKTLQEVSGGPQQQ
jgi:hypothetical protein